MRAHSRQLYDSIVASEARSYVAMRNGFDLGNWTQPQVDRVYGFLKQAVQHWRDGTPIPYIGAPIYINLPAPRHLEDFLPDLAVHITRALCGRPAGFLSSNGPKVIQGLLEDYVKELNT